MKRPRQLGEVNLVVGEVFVLDIGGGGEHHGAGAFGAAAKSGADQP